MRNKLEFLNRNGEKFDWENDDLAKIEVKTREEKLVQPDFITEIPGIPLESDYQEIEPPNTLSQVQEMPAAQRTAAARKNAGRDMKVTTQITPRGVDDDASVIDVTGSDDESKFEGENNHFPAEGVDQEMKIESEDSGDSGVPPQDAGLRRSSRRRTPGVKFIPTMTG